MKRIKWQECCRHALPLWNVRDQLLYCQVRATKQRVQIHCSYLLTRKKIHPQAIVVLISTDMTMLNGTSLITPLLQYSGEPGFRKRSLPLQVQHWQRTCSSILIATLRKWRPIPVTTRWAWFWTYLHTWNQFFVLSSVSRILWHVSSCSSVLPLHWWAVICSLCVIPKPLPCNGSWSAWPMNVDHPTGVYHYFSYEHDYTAGTNSESLCSLTEKCNNCTNQISVSLVL